MKHQKLVLKLCDKFKVNWNIVYSTALQHQVIPLVYFNLLKCKNSGLEIDSTILNNFKIDTIVFSPRKLKQEQNIAKILSYFNEKSVDVMLIKGAALNFTVYKDFSGYVIGDIDLILRNHRENISEQEDQEDINFFEELNVSIEWERFCHHDVSKNGILQVDFRNIWNNAKETLFEGRKVFIMSPEDMLIITCINSCRKRFFRLKSLCDIAEIVNYFPKLNWDAFINNAKKYHCHYIIYTSLLVTYLTVKNDLPKEIFNNLNINRFKAKLIYLIARYLCNHVPLNSLLPSNGITILGKNVNLALVLVLLVCNWLKSFKVIFHKKNIEV